jgi:hypothetical protein
MLKQYSGLALFLLALLCRLPFLDAGYGEEFDAWSNVLNARLIAETGVYEVSRLPGHPLQEILYTGLWSLNQSAFFFNLWTALISALAVWAFYQILLLHQVERLWQWTLAFNFIPVFFVASTSSIDYNFALAFILLAYRSLLKGQYLWVGIFIGLATGFRISSLGFIAPFIVLLGFRNWRSYFTIALGAGLLAMLAYSLPFIHYGWAFLDFHKPPFPSWASVLYKLSIGIWGFPFLLFIAAAIIRLFRGFEAKEMAPHLKASRLLPFLVLVIALQLFVFLRLPFKAEFFIPAVPFVLILMAIYLPKGWSRWAAYSSLASLLIFGFDYENPWRGAEPGPAAFKFEAGGQTVFCDPVKGALRIDQEKRSVRSQTVDRSIEVLKKAPPSLVVAGWYWPELVFKYPLNHHLIDHYSSQAEIDSAREAGLRILYLPEIDAQNEIMEGHNLVHQNGQAVLSP